MNPFFIMVASMIFGIAETAYFGWNMHPESALERYCDNLVLMGFAYGAGKLVERMQSLKK